jgi:methyl acetate hydrolase
MAQRLASSAAILKVLRAAVDRGDAPAISAVVVTPDAELVRAAAGLQGVTASIPAAAESIFRIYSMTKPVTSLAAMMLVEEKKLALDDPIAKFLSGKDAMQAVITVDGVGHFVSHPPEKPITVRHLLTHTSGMGYASTSDLVQRVRENAPSIPETSILANEPGERWLYGPSTKALGDIVASVSGMTLDTFFAERIFAPLGMHDTSFLVGNDQRARLVTSHERQGSALVEQKTPEQLKPEVRGDGGLYSTAPDYGRFVRLLLNRGTLDGKRLVSDATIAAMTTNQIGALTITAPSNANPGNGRDKFGFGFQIATLPKADPQRRSNGSFSWSGAGHTYFWGDPVRNIGGVLLMQVLPLTDPAGRRVLDEFETAVYASVK